MIDYAPAISALETELALMDERRPLIEASLTALRRLTGDAPRASKPRKATAPRHVDRRAPARPASASSAAAFDHRTAILDALRANGAMKPGDLQKAVRLTPHTLRAYLAPLIEQGLVSATGATLNRRFELTAKGRNGSASSTIAPAPVTKPTPTPETPAAPKAQTHVASKVDPPSRPAPSSSMAAGFNLVEARDAAIKARLKPGKATLEELLAAMPSEPGQSADERTDACKKALRRLVLKGVVADVGNKFQLV